MLKTISAALLVASIATAPALAATVIKTERAPVTRTVTTKIVTVKPSIANARAQAVVIKKVRHHRHHKHFGHLRTHKHVGAVVTKKVVLKRVSAATPAKTIIVKKKI